jgi:hypothetical protein
VARRGSGSTRHYGSSSYASRKHMTGQRRSLGLVAASAATAAAHGAIVGGSGSGGAGSDSAGGGGAQDLRHYC